MTNHPAKNSYSLPLLLLNSCLSASVAILAFSYGSLISMASTQVSRGAPASYFAPWRNRHWHDRTRGSTLYRLPERSRDEKLASLPPWADGLRRFALPMLFRLRRQPVLHRSRDPDR